MFSSREDYDDYNRYKPNWYGTSILIKNPDQFEEIVKWIEDNIQGHEKHVVWRLTNTDDSFAIQVKFRHEKDYSWFVIRWN